jgi:hypothetical protein
MDHSATVIANMGVTRRLRMLSTSNAPTSTTALTHDAN